MDFVSVVIPCRNEKKNIEASIYSVLNSDRRGIELEILIVDGRSDDGTIDVLNQLGKGIPELKILDNPAKTTPYAFNIGVKGARGNYILIMGARQQISSNYIRDGLAILKSDDQIQGIGGVVHNLSESSEAMVISKAMKSPFGVGMGNFRSIDSSGYVDTIGTPMYRTSLFDRVGLFNEDLARNQDDEFNYRVIKSGGKLWLEKSISISYYVRPSYSKLFAQYKQYGYWKVYVNKLHRAFTSFRQLVPAAFILFLLSLPLWWLFDASMVYLGISVTYLLMGSYFAFKLSSSLKEALKVQYCFTLLHFAYGSGYLLGLIDFMILNRKPAIRASKLTR